MTLATDRPHGERRCHACDYSREGLPVTTPCPECGEASPVALRRFRGRPLRRWWFASLVVFVALLAIDLANAATSIVLDVLIQSEAPRGEGPFPPLLLVCALPSMPVLLLVSLLFRRGEPEIWSIEENRLVVSRHNDERVIAWRYRDLLGARIEAGSPLGSNVELFLRQRQRPARRLQSDFSREITLDLCELLNERIREARAVDVAREAEADAESAIRVAVTPSFLAHRIAVLCPRCHEPRAVESAVHTCSCGAPGHPPSWHLVPVAACRLFEDDTRVRPKHAVLSDMLDLRIRTLPVRILPLAIVTLVAGTLYGLLDEAISGPAAGGHYAFVVAILIGPVAHVLFGARWSGARAILVVRPGRLELVTPAWSRELPRSALSTTSRLAAIARLGKDTLSLVLIGSARRRLRRALAETEATVG